MTLIMRVSEFRDDGKPAKAPGDPAPYTHFGPTARRSAGFQPAVSQGFQPAGVSSLPTRPEPPPALPIGNRRPAPKAFGVHRLETCATSAHEMRVRCRGDRRTPRSCDGSQGFSERPTCALDQSHVKI